MTSIPPDALAQGVLLALDRDRARMLFGAREPLSLQETVCELVTCESLWEERDALALEGRGPAIQRVLDAVPLSDLDTRPLLAQTLTGGRPLADQDPWHVFVVRPDVVPQVADALAKIDVADLQRTVTAGNSEAGGARTIALLAEILEFYRRAAERRSAVAYCVGQMTN
jgi:hypothetical protein